jgi:uncharacterized membrane protein YozB (DUF420 family)
LSPSSPSSFVAVVDIIATIVAVIATIVVAIVVAGIVVIIHRHSRRYHHRQRQSPALGAIVDENCDKIF